MNHLFVASVILGEIQEMETDAGWIQNANMQCKYALRTHSNGFSLSKFSLEDCGMLHHFTHMLKHTEQVAFTATRGPQ